MSFLTKLAREIVESLLAQSGSTGSVWVIVSGGPAEYSANDKTHDQRWDNYVGVLLRQKSIGLLKPGPNEEIIWMIYKPAYQGRWWDDKYRRNADSVQDAAKLGYDKGDQNGYVYWLEDLSKKRFGKPPVWLKDADDFWTKIRALDRPMSRMWFIGHGSAGNLWFQARRTGPDAGSVVAPRDEANAILYANDIAIQLKKSQFVEAPEKPTYKRTSMFLACNSAAFAKEFTKTLDQYADGSVERVTFAQWPNTGKVQLTKEATWLAYDIDGKQLSKGKTAAELKAQGVTDVLQESQ
jgi:hypothetical protein